MKTNPPETHRKFTSLERFLIALMIAELFLLLSERYYPKGWALVVAITCVVIVAFFFVRRDCI